MIEKKYFVIAAFNFVVAAGLLSFADVRLVAIGIALNVLGAVVLTVGVAKHV